MTVELLLRRAPLLSLQARYMDVLAMLLPHQDAVEAIDDPVLSGPFYFRLALTASMVGMHDDAARLAGRARAHAERSGDVVTLGRTHYVLAATAFAIGPAVECVQQARRAIALLEPTAERAALGLAWWICALGHHLLGEFAAALDANTRVEAIATSVGDRGLDAMGAIAAAWTHITLGDTTAATAAAERAVASAHDRYIESRARAVLGYTRVIGAADPSGLTLITEALDLIPRRDNTSAILSVLLSDAYARFGDAASARKAAEEGLVAAREARFAWGIAAAQRARGRVAAAAGDIVEARTALVEAREGFLAIQAAFDAAITCLDLATLVREGDFDAAAAQIAAARSHFVALGLEDHARRADALAADLARRRA